MADLGSDVNKAVGDAASAAKGLASTEEAKAVGFFSQSVPLWVAIAAAVVFGLIGWAA